MNTEKKGVAPASPFSYTTKQPGGDKTHRPPDTAARLRPTEQPVYFATERAVCDISRCLRNNPKERFQSIDEIIQFYETEKDKTKELNPFEDMFEFHSAILSVVPEFYNYAFSITDKDVMCDLFDSIFSGKYNHSLEFNTGIGNNSVSSITKLENNDFLMGPRQLNIRSIWGLLTDDVYDDILLLLAPGENRHFEPGENSQFQSGRNRQSVPGGCSQPRFGCRF